MGVGVGDDRVVGDGKGIGEGTAASVCRAAELGRKAAPDPQEHKKTNTNSNAAIRRMRV